MKNCVFCQIVERKVNAYILDETDSVIVFMSLENHPMVVTKKHISNIYLLDDLTASAIMIEAVKIAKAVKNALKCDGVNIVQSNEVAAGQDVPHFHLHVKSRLNGDKVILSWSLKRKSDEVRRKTAEIIKKALL